MKHVFEQVRVLYLGLRWSSVDIYTITVHAHEKIELQTEIVFQSKQNSSQCKVVGLQIPGTSNIDYKVMSFVQNKVIKKAEYSFFIVDNAKQIPRVIKTCRQFNFHKTDVYGVDPDYYLSLVPIGGFNNMSVQKYVFNLKSDYSIKGRVKRIIRNILVDLRLYNRLYEHFVILVESKTNIK